MHIMLSFPTLFPYGCGGFFGKRKTNLTFREQLKYFLNINDNRFRTHMSFMFVCFNIIQRKEAYNKIKLTTLSKYFTSTLNIIRNVSINDLEQAKLEISNNKQLSNPRINELVNKLNNTFGIIQGSKSSLKFKINELRNYIIHFGIPAFFITINPADIHSPLLLKLAGEDNIESILSNDSTYRRSIIVKQNPYIQSVYFDTIITAFITNLLNYNKKTRYCWKDKCLLRNN